MEKRQKAFFCGTDSFRNSFPSEYCEYFAEEARDEPFIGRKNATYLSHGRATVENVKASLANVWRGLYFDGTPIKGRPFSAEKSCRFWQSPQISINSSFIPPACLLFCGSMRDSDGAVLFPTHNRILHF
ncbi:hypothetical protein CDAR_603121 [Caerostris darwini]|uniref:Uncharacterized protein n=1 Tax=Caerostris darwini TaxID=1538125 RepID=A0AAV4W8H2_9ARAC|nr:hypothetical protein CDAR_603121 [Caerostris darwini]